MKGKIKGNAVKVNSLKDHVNEIIPIETVPSNRLLVSERLHGIVPTLKNVPSVLQGRVHSIKIDEQYREGRVRHFFEGRSVSRVPKLVLTGKWLQAAGFESKARVEIIPLHKMLIIVPEE